MIVGASALQVTLAPDSVLSAVHKAESAALATFAPPGQAAPPSPLRLVTDAGGSEGGAA